MFARRRRVGSTAGAGGEGAPTAAGGGAVAGAGGARRGRGAPAFQPARASAPRAARASGARTRARRRRPPGGPRRRGPRRARPPARRRSRSARADRWRTRGRTRRRTPAAPAPELARALGRATRDLAEQPDPVVAREVVPPAQQAERDEPEREPVGGGRRALAPTVCSGAMYRGVPRIWPVAVEAPTPSSDTFGDPEVEIFTSGASSGRSTRSTRSTALRIPAAILGAPVEGAPRVAHHSERLPRRRRSAAALLTDALEDRPPD